MRVEVFAVLKDHFDAKFSLSESVDSVSDLKQRLINEKPSAAGILQACRFAVNNEFVSEDYKLNKDDTIAILPPASGG